MIRLPELVRNGLYGGRQRRLLRRICCRIPLFITAQAEYRIVKHLNEFLYLRYLLTVSLEHSHDLTCSEGCLYCQLSYSPDACLPKECPQRICAYHCRVSLEQAVINSVLTGKAMQLIRAAAIVEE